MPCHPRIKYEPLIRSRQIDCDLVDFSIDLRMSFRIFVQLQRVHTHVTRHIPLNGSSGNQARVHQTRQTARDRALAATKVARYRNYPGKHECLSLVAISIQSSIAVRAAGAPWPGARTLLDARNSRSGRYHRKSPPRALDPTVGGWARYAPKSAAAT